MEARPLHDDAVARALEDAAARRIIAACIRAPRSVKDIQQHTDVPMASLYRKVNGLVGQGVLVVERSAMTSDGKPYDLYRSRVRSARLEVEADRVEVTWRPNEGLEDRIATMWQRLGS